MTSRTTAPTLATGAPLNAESWANFVERLRFHCRGEGVREHSTSCAVFEVQKLTQRVVPETFDFEGFNVIDDEGEAIGALDYFSGLSASVQAQLDAYCPEGFKASSAELQTFAIEACIEPPPEMSHFNWVWEPVGQHLTPEAAEAFVQKHRYRYPHGVRVTVESSLESLELNALRQAILDGLVSWKA